MFAQHFKKLKYCGFSRNVGKKLPLYAVKKFKKNADLIHSAAEAWIQAYLQHSKYYNLFVVLFKTYEW